MFDINMFTALIALAGIARVTFLLITEYTTEV